MQSLRELFRIGKGPSSSHTIGPEYASKLFLEEHPEADCFKVILYGSLAVTVNVATLLFDGSIVAFDTTPFTAM